MSNLRKDNYAVATTDSGNVYGKVTKVEKNVVVLATPAGESARVLRANTTKISAKEYLDHGTETAATFDAADAGVVEAPAPAAEEVGVAPVETTSVVRPGGDRKPGLKGTGKKADAIAAYALLAREIGGAPTRKDVMAVFTTMIGLSKAGANTYYQNIKSGKWSVYDYPFHLKLV